MTRLLPCFTVAVATATATTTRVTMDDEPAFFAAALARDDAAARWRADALCRDPAEFDYARPRARMQL